MTTQVIQIGGNDLRLNDKLTADFQYQYFTATEYLTATIEEQELVVAGEIATSFWDAVFIVGADVSGEVDERFLTSLPANSLIYDRVSIMGEAAQRILKLKNAAPADLTDPSAVAYLLSHTFFAGQKGFKFRVGNWVLRPDFDGVIKQNGNQYLEIESQTPAAQTVADYNYGNYLADDTDWEVKVECEQVTETMEAVVELWLISPDTESVQRVDITGTDLLTPLKFHVAAGANLHVTVRVSGEGVFRLGMVHFHQLHGEMGPLLVGTTERTMTTGLRPQLLTYFNAGDLKPPLNVYFGGYHTAETFEGFYMMRNLGAPFLLVLDPRLDGGAFYTGDTEMEQAIVDVIQSQLQNLGFERDELVLAGLSMGSFGGLYYSARLLPRAVVVGKPLINLGTIAENERINRPDAFPTSLDLIRLLTGDLTYESFTQANQIFWETFKDADLAQTIFAIAYMKNDDYDANAFRELAEYLRGKFPNVNLRYKGLVGRHNDDTPGIVKWFLQQYRQILRTEFGRQMVEG